MRNMKRKILLLAVMLMVISPAALSEDSSAIRVSYLGPEGTYTEEAARLWFSGGETLMPKETVDEAVAALVTGEADYAVIPQENTIGGAVLNYVDALIAAEDTYVAGEVILPISQTLMAVPGSDAGEIKTVYSHAQGIAQSAAWREENMPDAETVEMPSTAAAASYVAEQGDTTIAAIAAPGAAGLYGLEVLASDVQISTANKTRFYILSTAPQTDDTLPRAVFVASCEAGRIDDIIMAIHDAGLEPVCLHDRPEGSSLGTYYYVIEAENENGIQGAWIDSITSLEGIRCAGRFRSIEK